MSESSVATRRSMLVVGTDLKEVEEATHRAQREGIVASGLTIVTVAPLTWHIRLRRIQGWLRRAHAAGTIRPGSSRRVALEMITESVAAADPTTIAALDRRSANILHSESWPHTTRVFGLEVAIRVAHGAPTEPAAPLVVPIPLASDLILGGTANADGICTDLARALNVRIGRRVLSAESEPSPLNGPWDLPNQGDRGICVLTVDDLLDPEHHGDIYEWSVFRTMDVAARQRLRDDVRNARERRAERAASGSTSINAGVSAGVEGAEFLPAPLLGGPRNRGADRGGPALVVSWSPTGRVLGLEGLDSLVEAGRVRRVSLEQLPQSMRRLVLMRCDVVVDRVGLGGLSREGLEGLRSGALLLHHEIDSPAWVEGDVDVRNALRPLVAGMDWMALIGEAVQRRLDGPGISRVATAIEAVHGDEVVAQQWSRYLDSRHA